MKKYKDKIIIIILVCLLLAAIIYILLNLKQCSGDVPSANHVPNISTDDEAVDYDGNHQTAQLPNDKSGIIVPGFSALVFDSSKTIQQVNFYNPEANNCLFKMSLVVNGKTYWKSGWVEPGKCYYSITLTEKIPKGSYQGELLIECSTYDSKPLNSANVQFQLEVI
ncbi:hypothetical protein IJ556_04045 [bacterium]|nr:hypothetical protein [bacterium]